MNTLGSFTKSTDNYVESVNGLVPEGVIPDIFHKKAEDIVLPFGGELQYSNGLDWLRDYENGNSTLNAPGSDLYIGFKNTTGLNFLDGRGVWDRSTGNLGIGTTPDEKLDVGGNIQVNTDSLNSGIFGRSGFGTEIFSLKRTNDNGAGDSTLYSHRDLILKANSGTVQFKNGQLSIGGTNDEFKITRKFGYTEIQSFSGMPVSLNPQGNNVGIGTTSPSEKLEVNGMVRASSGYRCGEESTSLTEFYGWKFTTSESDTYSHKFFGGGNEKGKITGTGKMFFPNISEKTTHPTNYKAIYKDSDTGEFYTLV